MQLFLKNCAGKCVTIKVAPSDLIIEAKLQCFEREGIPVDHLRLFFRSEELQNDKTFEDYEFQNQSSIFYIMRTREDVRRNQPTSMKLVIQKMDQSFFEIEVNSDITVNELEEKISTMNGTTEADNKNLLFHGCELHRNALLTDYGIENNSVIYYAERMQNEIYIRSSGGNIPIPIAGLSDSIYSIKAKYAEIAMIKSYPSTIDLYYQEKKVEDRDLITRDYLTLKELKIPLEAVFDVR